MENKLPKGWVQINLVHDLDFLPTGTPIFKGKKKYYSTGSFKDLRCEAEGDYTFENRPSRANRIAFKGDVLQARMTGTEKAVLVNDILHDQLFSSGFIQLRPDPGLIEAKYLYYYFKSELFLSQRDEQATGSTQVALTDQGAQKIYVPLAPIEEQRRIVSALEKIYERIDNCQKYLQKLQSILRNFRQSIIVSAVSGKLTEAWRDNNKQLKSYHIPGSQYESVIEANDYPLTWRIEQLGKLTKLVTSGSRGWAKFYSASGSLFIRAQNINSDFLNLDDVAFVSLPGRTEGLRTKIQPLDLLVTITGANVAKTAVVDQVLPHAYVSQHIALIRLKDTTIAKFVFLNLISAQHGRKQLLEAAYGQGKPGLNLNNIKSLELPMPPYAEQQEIVRKVEELFRYADQIEDRYNKAKEWLDKIPQAILAKAFRGELVPQDANDEPASELLKRIKAEKELKVKVPVAKKKPKQVKPGRKRA